MTMSTGNKKKNEAVTNSAMTRWNWFLIFLAIRLLNVYVLRTAFSPDEQWQSLEVAHKKVFGYGHLTWEWLPCAKLRGALHPMIFVWFYEGVKFLGLDYMSVIAYGPRVLQAIIAACTEEMMLEVGSVLGYDKFWVFILSSFSWFHWFTLVRTFSSNLELFFLVAGVLCFEKSGKFSEQGLFFGALSCVIRPTAAPFWACYGLLKLVKDSDNYSFFRGIYVAVNIVAAVFLVFGVFVDSWFYFGLENPEDSPIVHPPEFVISLYNFFKFNVIEDFGGRFYGVHKAYWYLIDGLGGALLSYYPILFLVLWRNWYDDTKFAKKEMQNPTLFQKLASFTADKTNPMYTSTFLAIGIMSLSPHKEHRFLIPYMWIFLLPVSDYLRKVFAESDVKKMKIKSKKEEEEDKEKVLEKTQEKQRSKGTRKLVFLVFVVQVVAGIFLSTVHQRGGDEVLRFFRKRAAETQSIFFLTPCHAMPMHSYLHGFRKLGFLDCTPGTNQLNWRDRFRDDSIGVVSELFSNEKTTDNIRMKNFCGEKLDIWPSKELPDWLVITNVALLVEEETAIENWIQPHEQHYYVGVLDQDVFVEDEDHHTPLFHRRLRNRLLLRKWLKENAYEVRHVVLDAFRGEALYDDWNGVLQYYIFERKIK